MEIRRQISSAGSLAPNTYLKRLTAFPIDELQLTDGLLLARISLFIFVFSTEFSRRHLILMLSLRHWRSLKYAL